MQHGESGWSVVPPGLPSTDPLEWSGRLDTGPTLGHRMHCGSHTIPIWQTGTGECHGATTRITRPLLYEQISAIIGVSVCDNLINNFTVWYIHTSVQSVCMYYAWFYCFRIAMSLLSAGFIRPRWYILPTQTQMWLSMALFQMVNGTCWRPVHIMEPWQAETGKCSRLLGLHWVCSVSLPITYTTLCYLWVCWWYCQWSPTSCHLRQERRSVCRSPFFSHFPSCCSSCLTVRPRLALLHHSLVGLQGSLVLT